MIARTICLLIAGLAGWHVYREIPALKIDIVWLPYAVGAGVLAIVYTLLYLPLARPIADLIQDKLNVATHRGRHIRAGSGLDSIPATRPSVEVLCNICGGPGGPICRECEEDMSRSSRYSVPPK
jgi:hypothetical protein